MSTTEKTQEEIWQKLNKETAQITWNELAPQFASGQLIFVDSSLDLIDTAVAFAKDNHVLINGLLSENNISKASDEQAQLWQKNNQIFWAVVVKPWVLIQYVELKEPLIKS